MTTGGDYWMTADNHAGLAPLHDDPVEDQRDPGRRKVRGRIQRQTLAREHVQDRQRSEPPTIRQRIRHEVEGPLLVRPQWPRGRGTRTQLAYLRSSSEFARSAPLPVKPQDSLGIHHPALASEEHVEPAVAIPRPGQRQLLHPHP